MKALAQIKLLFIATVCVGCGAQQVSAELQPALLTEVSPQVRSEVQRVVSEAMGGVEINLGPEVFTENSLLVLERSPRQMRLIGRDMGQPIKFKLFLDGSTCWLVRLPDGPRWELEASCSPATPN